MKSIPSSAALTVTLALGLGCEARVEQVELVLGSVDSPPVQGPRGLDCVDTEGRLMACRTYDADPPRLSVVLDVIPLRGLPRCRPNALQNWCDDPTHDCTPDLDRRAIFEVEVPAERNLITLIEHMEDELSGQMLDSPILDEPVILRATFLALDETEARESRESFACEALVGCLYSCPVVLGGLEGELPLELDASNVRCMAEVHQCASNPMFSIRPDCTEVSATMQSADPECPDPT